MRGPTGRLSSLAVRALLRQRGRSVSEVQGIAGGKLEKDVSPYRTNASWSEFQTRGFAKQPPAAEVPVDHEHVNVSNEIEKELLKASETSGVPGLLQVGKTGLALAAYIGCAAHSFRRASSQNKALDVLDCQAPVIEQHGEDFDEQNVTTAFHELAKTAPGTDLKDVHVHDAFQALVDMAIMGRRRFNARLLTSIVQSSAALKFSDDALLDKLSQNLLGRMDKLDATEVTDLATGLAAMDHSPSVILFEALQKRANDIDGDFSAEQRDSLKQAFKGLGYDDYAKKL